MDIYTFAQKYTKYLKDLTHAISDVAFEKLPDVLRKPGFAIIYSDSNDKHMVFLTSLGRTNRVIIDGKETRHDGREDYTFVRVEYSRNTLEQILFSDTYHESLPFITFKADGSTIGRIALANSEYTKKYWNQLNGSFIICDGIPFSITREASLLVYDLVYGFEIGNRRQEKLIEFARLFGSERIIPFNEMDIRDNAFRDFFVAVGAIKKKEEETVPDVWSFTGFLKSLERSVKENVLILGSYNSDEDFDKVKRVLKNFGYNGFTLKDSPDLPIQSNLEKLCSGIMCCCFIIVFDSKPSGHLAEIGELLSKRFRPVIVIRHNHQPSSYFLEDKIRTDEYFKIAIISEISESELLPHVMWAKDKISKQIERFNEINYWRE